jgi:hypothetical protein
VDGPSIVGSGVSLFAMWVSGMDGAPAGDDDGGCSLLALESSESSSNPTERGFSRVSEPQAVEVKLEVEKQCGIS